MNLIAKHNKHITAIGAGLLNRTSHHVVIVSNSTIGSFYFPTGVIDCIESKIKWEFNEDMTLQKSSSNFATCVNWQPMIERFKNCIVLQSKN